MNILEAINEATKKLKKNHISTAKLDSEILLSKVLRKERKYIILNSYKELKKEYYIKFNKLVAKRSLGEPIA